MRTLIPVLYSKVQRRLIFALIQFFNPIGSTEYATRSLETTRLPPAPLDAGDIRLAQVFHDSNVLPIPASAGPPGPSIPPMIRESGLGSMGRHPTIATSSRMDAGPGLTSATTVAAALAETDDEVSPSNEDLFGQLPGGKRRTFILVEDPQRGSRVRVKVGLDKVNMDDLPDSYRKLNAVYPRTYFPVQMKDAPGQTVPCQRYFRDDTEIAEDDALVFGRTTVLAPSLDGEGDIEVPKISRRGHRKEVMLNDLAYRLSWSQSRVFEGRKLFLQQSCKLDPFYFKSLPFDPVSIPRFRVLNCFIYIYIYIFLFLFFSTHHIPFADGPTSLHDTEDHVHDRDSLSRGLRLTFIDTCTTLRLQ